MAQIMKVYIIMIDNNGLLAFQVFTLDRWNKLEAMYREHNLEKSHLLFKMKLNETEIQMVHAMIMNNKFHVAANMLLNLRKLRGDVE